METTNTFPLGRCYLTKGASLALQEAAQSPDELLSRHELFDFGDLGAEDWQANLDAIRTGDRVLSAYSTRKGEKLWVITEADRRTTVILLPSEY